MDLAIHLVDQVTESSGGSCRVTEGEIDHVTAVEGVRKVAGLLMDGAFGQGQK